ncbi:hypothetical protein EYR40_001055 [Pleurotus pulmonarius]|uniref:37S ribosomal protein mrp10, mitochondrial n=2 Tax=Pleurotus TaxID=5320 RepID=A0A067P058_PLEO1|nr:hypothetical protein EYR38_004298 [Pleurotus pulmonarius]KAF4608708.1 hypothetical protein EYR40_001055 [Pleurotus pulmonarius]KAF9500389.1 hypothetical protein BDN71DRAFT_1502052 [Pleurotus eryngii]KAJ8699845.1 hypothetical protein PTI98_002925 [Pleurotus ostreatus]KDQ33544.1 hypothetical protein PLEOSDRAFT_48210 [Pleurotus ostreatus PC15]
MGMHIKKLKVRPKKNATNNLCAPQLATLLGCWAATGDLHSKTQPCAEAAETLFSCMRTAPMQKKMHRPTINYHLARLGKTIQ